MSETSERPTVDGPVEGIVKTVCPYCGVGCGMVLQVREGKVTGVSGDRAHPANFGRLCTKGFSSAQALTDSGRMESAYLRASRQGEQMPVAIDEAIAEAARRLRGIIDRHGPEAVAFYVSGQMSLEAQYLANKLAKGFIRTNNIDSNSRLCMSSAASGYRLSLGADGPPGSYEDIDAAELFFVIGANMADCHPILFLRLRDRLKAGAKLIVVDPRRTATAEQADLFLQIRPGTDLSLLNGLLHLLVEGGEIDAGFIAAHTEGWEEMPAFLREFTPARVAEVTGLAQADIRQAARWIGGAQNWMSLWTMGLNQSSHGTWHTNAICNLHLATGAICRSGCGPFSLTGQPNAMGGREMGYLSHGLPGQRAVISEADRNFAEALWQVPAGSIQPLPGADAVSLFQQLQSGTIKAVWIICTNPVASVANRQSVIAGLREAELVIAQDAFLDTETNGYADILLPGALWAEANGVMVNSERTLTLMQRAVAPPGEAQADWRIIARIACAMGYGAGFSYASAAEVFDEIRQSANPATGYDIGGATHERLRAGPLQWPCAEGAGGRSPIRYRTAAGLRFPTVSGRARFFPRPALPPAELPDAEYPFILNTGRLPHQWHTMTKTGKIKSLTRLNPGPFIELHPEDAGALGVRDRDVVEIRSRRGRALLPAVVSPRVLPGGCFVPFHWNDVFGEHLAINEVTSDARDESSLQPAFKFCAVALCRSAQPSEAPRETEVMAGRVTEPPLDEAETLYVSGFLAGVRALGAAGGLPVLPPAAPLSAKARLWMDGVLAGMFSREGGAAVADVPPEVPAAACVTVLWASQTGNSEAVAALVQAELEQAGLRIRLWCMAAFPPAALGEAQRVILISSTYGDGEPPDNGRGLWEFLSGDDAPRLEHLHYAVCGLGDSSYDQFCQHGKNLDARLAELGARRLTGRLDCDGDHEVQISKWLSPLVGKLGGGAAKSDNDPPTPRKFSKHQPFAARLLANRRLNGPGAEKDTRFIALSLAGSDMRYQVGDALGVWPTNCPALVDEVLARAGLAEDAMVTVDKAGRLPLRAALAESFELTRPSRETLEFIAERSGHTELKSLLRNESKAALKQFLWGKQLPDLLAAFPVKTSAQEFASVLKPMQPRLYSIASSPAAHGGEVHLTVSTLCYGDRKGACSSFLAQRAAGSVPVFVQQSSHFRLPADAAAPVIMIGPGTGIAPFRAFLHERRARGATGRNWLFFGERHRATDFYFEDQFAAMRADGLLTELSLAFSRDQPEKIYVQHRMLEQGAALWAWLQEGACLYVCGDGSFMARDVEAALITIGQRHGGLSSEAAQEYLRALRAQSRYLRDVY
jgi:sulfite reductase (NADPH) flavoprotein alpha-component